MTESILVSELRSTILAEGGVCDENTRKLVELAQNQYFPAFKLNGRWHVNRIDMPKVQRALKQLADLRRLSQLRVG